MKRKTKDCPYCSESILETAKKCKHCWERLEEKHPKKTKIKTTSAWTSIINFFRFLWFILAAALFSYIALVLIGLLLGLFAMLNPLWLIIILILFTWLFFAIRWFLITGLAYVINRIFRIPVNKKLARIFFIIIFVLMCIDKIAAIWIMDTGASTTFNVFYTLIVIFVCVLFTVELKNICEIDEE